MIGFDPYDPHSLPPPVAPPPVRRNFNENVHVDTAPQTYASQMTGGARYDTGLPPTPITCLKCKRTHVDGVPVDVFKTEEVYNRDVAMANGHTKKACLPPCPNSTLAALVPFVYHMKPCGCVVTEADMLTERQKLDMIDAILQTVQSMVGDRAPTNRETTDYWLVVAADRIDKLSNGRQRLTLAQPTVMTLTPEVVAWASSRQLTLPEYAGQTAPLAPAAGFGYRPGQAMPLRAARRQQEFSPTGTPHAVSSDVLDVTPLPGAKSPKTVPPAVQLRPVSHVKDLQRRRRKIIIDIATE